MFTSIRTFKSRLVSFADALEAHAMMTPLCKEFMRMRGLRGKATSVPHLAELWTGLCAVQDPAKCRTVIPACVAATMPPEYAAVIRRSAGVTTAFAFCELAKSLAHTKDLADDLEVRARMIIGWREFEKRRQEANQVQEGFGCDDSQSWLTLRDVNNDLSQDPDLLSKIMAIAALAGRMFEKFGYTKKDSPNEDPEEAVGATIGGDIDRILPTELAMLADSDTEDMQAMKILQARAAIQQMQGIESKTRGPLVLALDESGSMHESQSFGRSIGRNTWAKACAVALTRIAWQENRPVVCVHFGTGTEVQSVPKDDFRAMFEMARSFLSGGTDFSSALRASIVEVGDLASQGFIGADILLITDGEERNYAAHDSAIDDMDAQGIKLWTVAIGNDLTAVAPVRKRAERYTYATDRQIADGDAATDLANGLQSVAMGNAPDRSLN